MKAEGFNYAAMRDRVSSPQPAAARAIITGGVFEAALRIVLFIGYRFILGYKNNRGHHRDGY